MNKKQIKKAEINKVAQIMKKVDAQKIEDAEEYTNKLYDELAQQSMIDLFNEEI